MLGIWKTDFFLGGGGSLIVIQPRFFLYQHVSPNVFFPQVPMTIRNHTLFWPTMKNDFGSEECALKTWPETMRFLDWFFFAQRKHFQKATHIFTCCLQIAVARSNFDSDKTGWQKSSSDRWWFKDVCIFFIPKFVEVIQVWLEKLGKQLKHGEQTVFLPPKWLALFFGKYHLINVLEEVSNDEFPVYSWFFCWVQYPKNMSKNGCFEVSRVFAWPTTRFFQCCQRLIET